MTRAATFLGHVLAFLAVTLALASVAAAQQASSGAAGAYSSAAALQDRGLYDLAAEEWRALISQYPADPLAVRAEYNLGVCCFQAGEYREAAQLFAQAADAKGDDAAAVAESALANLGLAYFNLAAESPAAQAPAAYERAVAALDRLGERFPKSEQLSMAAFYRAESLAALGRTRDAARGYHAVLADDRAGAHHSAARLGLAAMELDLGQADAAEATLNTLLASAPAGAHAGEAYRLRGEARLVAGKHGAAADDFAKAAGAQGFAGAPQAMERQAFALYSAKAFDEAARVYDELATRHAALPVAAEAPLAAAKCLLLAGRADDAARRLEALWSNDPSSENAEAAHWLVETLLKQKRYEHAAQVARQAIDTRPPDEWSAKLQLGLADALYEEPRTRDQSLPIYQRLAAEHGDKPAGVRGAYLAAHTALVLGRADQAARLATAFCQRHPNHSLTPDARQIAAQAAEKLGDARAARRLYQDLLRRYPQDARRDAWTLRAAELASRQTDWREVVELIEPRLTNASATKNSDAALLLLAEAERGLGDQEQAERTFSRLIGEHPVSDRRADALYQRGEIRTRLGRREEANRDFRAIAGEYDDHAMAPFALYALASNLVADEKLKEATDALRRLLSNYDSGPVGQAKFLLAGALQRQGEFQSALGLLDDAAAPAAEKLYLRGVCLAGVGDRRAARGVLEKFLGEHGDHTLADRAAYELAWVLRDQKETIEAISAFESLAKAHPQSPLAGEAWFRAGELLYEQRQHAGAASRFEAAAEAPSADGRLREQALHMRGWALFEADDPAGALEAFNAQLALAPEGARAADAKIMVGECRFALGEHAEALEAYNEALNPPPPESDRVGPALLHAGQAAAQVGEWEASLEWLDRARGKLGKGEQSDEAAYERAWALVNLRRPDEAKPEFERLVNSGSGPLAARSQFMLGELQFADKEYEDAVRTFFRVAYGYGGKDAPAEYHAWQSESLFEAARCLEALGRTEPAQKLYVELLERFPESPKARHARARLQPGSVR